MIGLGAIGGGVATCLVRAGRPLSIYDIRPEAAANWPGLPAPAASCAEVARASDVVMIAVVDAAQARAAMEGPDGLLAGAHPGLTLVMLSTLSLDEIEALAKVAATKGVALIDCGVTGGPAAARKGLVSLVGAEPALFERVRPVLEDFSQAVLHMGGPGTGMAAKIARNVVIYATWRAAYEGGRLARRAGVDLDKLVAAIELSTPNAAGPTYWLKQGGASPDRRGQLEHVLAMLEKDLDAAVALSARTGAPVPVAQITRASGAAIIGLAEQGDTP